MNHIDLFSGIGGFALAARNVWGGAYKNIAFCEINKYAQAVLRNQFGKDITIYGDIRGLSITNANNNGSHEPKDTEGSVKGAERDTQRPNEFCKLERSNPVWPTIDLLTGGFPCQPFSQAGKRKGTDDDRYLWPEMLRVIREFHPTWVVAENVRGLLSIQGGVVFEQVCVDLENEGYEVQPFVIPACGVNAPHRRDRVWIIGHLHGERRNQGAKREVLGAEQSSDTAGGSQTLERSVGDARNPEPAGLPDRDAGAIRRPEADEKCERPNGGRFTAEQWNENWLEVATRFCGVDDGLPADLDGATLSKAGHRVERLKALGNAIVPQVAEQIMQAIKETEQC